MIWMLAIVCVYLLACFGLAYRYVHPSRTLSTKPPNAESLSIPGPVADIPIYCTSGLAAGRPKSQVVYILVHGYGGNRDSWAQTLEDLEAKGFEVVAPEMPGHGSNPDGTVGFGLKEARCVVATARWVRSRFASELSEEGQIAESKGPSEGMKRLRDEGQGTPSPTHPITDSPTHPLSHSPTPRFPVSPSHPGAPSSPKEPRIVLVGVSMGGAACWIASGLEPDWFQAVVTEGAFARLDWASDRWFAMLLPAGHVILRPVRWFAEAMSGVRTSSIAPVTDAAKWRGRPALIIQCEFDSLIEARHAEALAQATAAPVWTVPATGHAQGYSAAPQDYLKRLIALGEGVSPNLESGP